ncbi:MAG: hypothetical protein AVDCRST_MAG71-2471, partial [uncultured Lysobacter sp.]
ARYGSDPARRCARPRATRSPSWWTGRPWPLPFDFTAAAPAAPHPLRTFGGRHSRQSTPDKGGKARERYPCRALTAASPAGRL